MDTLIEDLTGAAEEAIERAAAEAAKAAALAGIEREASLAQARSSALREAQQWQREYQEARSRGVKNAVITGVICFFSGLFIGAGGVLIIQGGR